MLSDFDLDDVFAHLNENALIRGQFRVRQGDMGDSQYEAMLAEKIYPMLKELKKQCKEEALLRPRAVYGYFPCQSKGDELIVYEHEDLTCADLLKLPHGEKLKERVRFRFPRQDFGRRLCISDFFRSVDEGFDILPLQLVTMGEIASRHAQSLFAQNKYSDYLYFHGLSVESAEGLAEVVHKRIRAELGFAAFDAQDRRKFFQQGYRGTRYSFGYPACPNLEDQVQLFDLLKPEEIGVELTEEFQLDPEQSTSALVVVHPEAKYFNINRKLALKAD